MSRAGSVGHTRPWAVPGASPVPVGRAPSWSFPIPAFALPERFAACTGAGAEGPRGVLALASVAPGLIAQPLKGLSTTQSTSSAPSWEPSGVQGLGGSLGSCDPPHCLPRSHVHPEAAEAAGQEERALRPGHRVLLRAAPGLHQRPQPGRQLAGHGPAPQLRAQLHPVRVRAGAGGEPPRDPARAPQGGEAPRQEDEGTGGSA